MVTMFKPKTQAAPQNASRYAGIQANGPREPMPSAGTYLLRVLGSEEGRNPGKGTESFKTRFEVVEVVESKPGCNEVGASVFIPHRIAGNGASMGLARVKAQVMACAGFDDESGYDAFDPQGLFIDACAGKSNEYSPKIGSQYVGRLVYCQVTRGKLTPDGGDYYREYAWASAKQ